MASRFFVDFLFVHFKWILTAAHCIHWIDPITKEMGIYGPEDFVVILGK